MIPKVIHYCWFGGNPLPDNEKKCIESWKKFCPDYEIKEWNEDNFDLNICLYVKQAYKEKKWAFVSDYARFWILYNFGGLYFDTDVEIVKSLDKLILKGPFMGMEKDPIPELNQSGEVNPGLGLAAYPNLCIYKEILDFYNNISFLKNDGSYNLTTVVSYVTEILLKNGLKNEAGIQNVSGIYIYPKAYFCPIDYRVGLVELTENTYSIHHYHGSWLSNEQKKALELRKYFSQRLGNKVGFLVGKIYLIPSIVKRIGIKYTLRLFYERIIDFLKIRLR